MACQTTTHLGYNWCIAVLTMLAVGVRGHPEQEPELRRGRVSQGKGEEARTREQTWTKPGEWTAEIGDSEVQNYTITQKRKTIDYEATLCVRHRMKKHFQCIRPSYLGMTAPSDTCRRDTQLTAEQCAIMGSTRVREEETIGRGKHLGENFGANQFMNTATGEIYHAEGETHGGKARELNCPHKVVKM